MTSGGVEPREDIVQRAKAALDSDTWCWTGPQTPVIVRELVAELQLYRLYVAALRDKSERDICPVCSYLWHECECGVLR